MSWFRRFLKPKHDHLWRWVTFPYIRQCSRCGLLEGERGAELTDNFKDYIDYLQEYSKTRMFPKSAVTGYHAFREGCCPLAKTDPIHDPENLKHA